MGRHSLSNGTRERYRGCTRCVCRSRDDRIVSLLERNYRRTVMLTLPSMTSIRINTQNRADSESHSRVDSDHFRQRKQVSFCGNQVSPRFGSRGKGPSVRCPLDSGQGARVCLSGVPSIRVKGQGSDCQMSPRFESGGRFECFKRGSSLCSSTGMRGTHGCAHTCSMCMRA